MLIFLSEVNASYSCHVGREGKNISVYARNIVYASFLNHHLHDANDLSFL